MGQSGLERAATDDLRPQNERTQWTRSEALLAQLPQAQRIQEQHAESEGAPNVLRAYRL
jgi:cyclopropane-fatty-acyl-phospholipid synthase